MRNYCIYNGLPLELKPEYFDFAAQELFHGDVMRRRCIERRRRSRIRSHERTKDESTKRRRGRRRLDRVGRRPLFPFRAFVLSRFRSESRARRARLRWPPADQSSTRSLISSELAFSSGAYIAEPRVGRALNLPGISARMR